MLGILTAMPFEKDDILSISANTKTDTICKIDFISGKINDIPIVIAACGEGKVNASRCAQIMIDYYHVDLILNVGVAGSMKSTVKKGDIVVANQVVQHDYNMTAIGVPVGMIPRGKRNLTNPWGEEAKTFISCSQKIVKSICATLDRLSLNYHIGTIATGDLFVAEKKKKDSILGNFEVLACEMEGAAIAYVCDAAEIEFAEIRDISDNADSNAEDSYFGYRKQYSLAQILLEVIEHLGEVKE